MKMLPIIQKDRYNKGQVSIILREIIFRLFDNAVEHYFLGLSDSGGTLHSLIYFFIVVNSHPVWILLKIN